MTTSGSYNFAMNGNELIAEALYTLNVYRPGETPSTADYTSCRRSLNMMLKAWQQEDLALWLQQEMTLLLELNEVSYLLGPAGDHYSATVVKTEIATAANLGGGSITVDDDAGIFNADYIGIELDDGTLQWTTVNGVPAANVVTLTATLTDDVAIDNHVYTYATKGQRPLEIIEARLINDDIETTLSIISRSDYMSLSNKSTTGQANQVYYDPQQTNGIFRVWPGCDDVKYRIKMTIRRPIMDFDAAADDADFPSYCCEAVILNLALRLSLKYPRQQVIPGLVEMAIDSKRKLLDFDRETTSVFFQPNLNG